MAAEMKRILCLLLVMLCCAGCTTQPPSQRAETTASNTQPPTTVQTTPEGDWAEQMVEAFARANDIPVDSYPTRIIDLLKHNPETETFVLEFPLEYGKLHEVDLREYADSDTVPLFLQWDKRWGYLLYGSGVAGLTACGPLCLSMAAFYHTGDEDMTPEDIIAFAKQGGYCTTGSGSYWTLISEGAKKLGLSVQELPPAENHIKQALDRGNPVIMIMGPGDFTAGGHYILVRGYDPQTGELLINDPNSRIKSEKSWAFSRIEKQIRNLWEIGPGEYESN